MYPAFPAPPFTREGLARHFGFQVPPPFVTFLNALCEDCASGEAVYNRVVDSLEWLLVSEYGDSRYQQTPPELFPLAMTGVDGGHFGYLIHAPELALSVYPIACFEPMDSNGAYLLGTSTFEAVETEISANIRYAQEDDWQSSPASFEWWPEVSARLRQLGIVPDPSSGEGFIDVFDSRNDYERLARISTRRGARTSLFLPTLDRLAVAVRAAELWIYRPMPGHNCAICTS
jgi:hypothetical protein